MKVRCPEKPRRCCCDWQREVCRQKVCDGLQREVRRQKVRDGFVAHGNWLRVRGHYCGAASDSSLNSRKQKKKNNKQKSIVSDYDVNCIVWFQVTDSSRCCYRCCEF